MNDPAKEFELNSAREKDFIELVQATISQTNSGSSPKLAAILGDVNVSHQRDFVRTVLSDALLGYSAPLPADYRHRLHDLLSDFASVVDEVCESVQGLRSTSDLSDRDTQNLNNSTDEQTAGTIGQFELMGKIGRGGYGTVFRAWDTKLKREVAVKLPRATDMDAEDRIRFLNEAQSAAQLRHPNTCPVYEVGETDGRPYIVMAYIPGQSLDQRIRSDGPMDQWEAVELIRKVAAGLAAAHEQGIIHRDLKPANILLDARGEPIITDFGLARYQTADAAHMTQTGQVMGTPAYMAPEQARGQQDQICPATDVYSLGVVLFELTTGTVPFSGSIPDMLIKIVQDPAPRLSSRGKPFHPQLEACCAQALAKDVQQRFASIEEFVAALPSTTAGPIDLAQNKKSPPTAKMMIVAAGVIALGLVAFLAWSSQQNRRKDQGIATAKQQAPIPAEKTEPKSDQPANPTNRPDNKKSQSKTVQVEKVASSREIADWIIKMRGGFHLQGQRYNAKLIRSKDDIPTKPFVIGRISMRYRQKVDDEQLQVLKGVKSVTSLRLTMTRVGDKGAEIIATMPKLGLLDLSHTRITNDGLRHLAKLKNLHMIMLNDTGVSDAAMQHLGKITTLVSLHFNKTSVTGSEFRELQTLRRLTTLSLGDTSVDDKALKALTVHRKLESLDLSGTAITKAAAADLKVMTSLRSLNLAGTQFDLEAVKQLSPLRLRYLTLTNTSVTKSDVPELQKVFPGCTFEFDRR